MKELGKSFVYAWRGLAFCVNNERNMRIHITLSVYMYIYLFVYDFFAVDRTQLAVLLLANALVFTAEIVNTAIESTINLIEKKYNKFCEIAKDTAAGAVLVCAAFSFAVGIAVLGRREAFVRLFDYYAAKPWMLAVLAASLVLSCVYIFWGPHIFIGRLKKRKRKGKTVR